jgi:hypothetical protein
MPEPTDTPAYYTDEAAIEIYTTEDGEPLTTEVSPVSSGGIMYRLYRALSLEFGRLWAAVVNVQDAALPDNPNFTIEDAHRWYARLGLYDSGAVSLSDMKMAITQKMSWAVTPLDKQRYLFIQGQLQAAGFDVYVYENRFLPGPTTKTVAEVLGIPVGRAVYGSFHYGEVDYNETYATAGVSLLANYIEDEKDATFSIGSNYRSTFFVAGATIDTFADVPESRHIEFRQLLLQLKPAQTVGFLFINYV